MDDEAQCVFCKRDFKPEESRHGFGQGGDGSVSHGRCLNLAREATVKALTFRDACAADMEPTMPGLVTYTKATEASQVALFDALEAIRPAPNAL